MLNPLFLKPVLNQLILDYPEIAKDTAILGAIKVRYESYSIFEELLQQEVMQEKIDFVEKMRGSLVQRDAEGNELHYWSMQYLVEKWIPEIDDSDRKLNEKYKRKEERDMINYMKRKADLTRELAEIMGTTVEDAPQI
jgi:hypothetical protein